MPLFDPDVDGADVQNANSAASLTTPFDADGLSVAEVALAQGFDNFVAVDASGAEVALAGAGSGVVLRRGTGMGMGMRAVLLVVSGAAADDDDAAADEDQEVDEDEEECDADADDQDDADGDVDDDSNQDNGNQNGGGQDGGNQDRGTPTMTMPLSAAVPRISATAIPPLSSRAVSTGARPTSSPSSPPTPPSPPTSRRLSTRIIYPLTFTIAPYHLHHDALFPLYQTATDTS